MPPEPWRRHDLLRGEPTAWPRVLRSQASFLKIPSVARWADSGWPLIVRRRAGGDDPGTVPVGLPLPPGEGKVRLSFQLDPADIAGPVSPRTLRVARGDAPPAWLPTVDAVLGLAAEIGVEPRVFGSLLWQGLTGLAYLSPGSDLDLLWPVEDAATAARVVCGLAAIESASPVRFDGEILLPDGGGVQWREWHRQPSEVLVKNLSGVELRAGLDLFALPASVP